MSFHPTSEITRDYILSYDYNLMYKFVNNPIVHSCGTKTKCRVKLLQKVLNRAIRPGCWARYFIIRIFGPDLLDIDRCNRLLERFYPEYILRQEYQTRCHVMLYKNEWLPDNVPLSMSTMRSGGQRSQFGNLEIKSPYSNNALRPISETPWKTNRRDYLGHYQSHHFYDEVLRHGMKVMYDELPILTSTYDIDRFNWPNSFDRYATFRAVDNEHYKTNLQSFCRGYMDALKGDPHKPSCLGREEGECQSVKYIFDTKLREDGALKDSGFASMLRTKTSFVQNEFSINNENSFKHELELQALNPVQLQVEEKKSVGKSSLKKVQDEQNNFIESPEKQSDSLNDKNQSNLVVEANNMNMVQKVTEKERRVVVFICKHRGLKRMRRLRYRNRLKSHKSNKSATTNNITSNEIDIESKVTSLTAQMTTKFTSENLTKASKSTNFDDNTLNSLKSL